MRKLSFFKHLLIQIESSLKRDHSPERRAQAMADKKKKDPVIAFKVVAGSKPGKDSPPLLRRLSIFSKKCVGTCCVPCILPPCTAGRRLVSP